LTDRTDLFKIKNLKLGEKAIVTDFYNSLEGRESESVIERVKTIKTLGDYASCYKVTALGK